MKTEFGPLRAALALALLSTLNSQLSTCFAQGSLTPPGAPAPLFKTLSQIEPRTPISAIPITLTNSGSYYLTANLTQTNAQEGIIIGAKDITIDLNGFALIGTNGSSPGISRISAFPNTCVRNGTVRNWSVGISINDTGVEVTRLEHLTVSSNSGDGITVFGSAMVTDCLVSGNGGHGIATAAFSVIRGCTAVRNNLDGIRVVADALVVENFCSGNATSGSTNAGIRATGNRNRIENNHVTFYQNGVVVSGGQSFIFRNTTANVGTNYIFAAGNSFGPTNAFPGVVTNHPWANF